MLLKIMCGCAIVPTIFTNLKGDKLAQPNFQYEKRQKELEKKRKKEEKLQQKQNKKHPSDNLDQPADEAGTTPSPVE